MSGDLEHDQIRRLAYQIWLKEGQPEGRDREHWQIAKETWAFQQRDADDTVDSSSQVAKPALKANKKR
jgi:hypothetical protein